jgi:hypothetical protein
VTASRTTCVRRFHLDRLFRRIEGGGDVITILGQASIFALVSMLMGILPLGMGVVYAIWPAEHRLNLMRPLSLATIFAAVSGTSLGILNVLRYIGVTEEPQYTRVVAIGLSEAMVPVFVGFGCLTAAWLCVAVGFWRRP